MQAAVAAELAQKLPALDVDQTMNLPNDFGKFFEEEPKMGGFGSGRKRGKNCTDEMRQIDIRLLSRSGFLNAGMSYGWQWKRNGDVVASINLSVEADRVWFAYRQRERSREWQDMRYPVSLERTACRFGGERVWWRCPATGCGRRVAILHGGSVFACRHCHRLAYRCQRENDDDRATRRADTLRDKLKWEPGILNGEGGKPKGMHWSTFQRLKTQHDAFVLASLAGMAERFGLRSVTLDDLGLQQLDDLGC